MGVEYGFEIVKLLIAVDVARSLVWPVRLWNTLFSVLVGYSERCSVIKQQFHCIQEISLSSHMKRGVPVVEFGGINRLK